MALTPDIPGFTYKNISTQVTTTVKNGAGFLSAIIINTPLALGVIIIYDNTVGSGTKIGTITLPAALLSSGGQAVPYGLQFATGLTIVTSGANVDITVIYS